MPAEPVKLTPVTLPDTCERVLVPVPLPAVRPTDDARGAFEKDDAALLSANARIRTGHDCVADQRRALAKGGQGRKPPW